MKAGGGGDVQVGVKMMDPMEPPQQEKTVIDPVPPVEGKVHEDEPQQYSSRRGQVNQT